ncbi:MAG: HAD family hydrolase, partial [Candidatus Omnitrophica bacterium]|nr:HAD family hydrolase [Candidatus Omnitrophota bacterium]
SDEETTKAILDILGISEFFDRIIGSANKPIRFGKIIKKLAKDYNVNFNQMVSVGDDEKRDIIPAGEYGLYTILVNNSPGKKVNEPSDVGHSTIYEALDTINKIEIDNEKRFFSQRDGGRQDKGLQLEVQYPIEMRILSEDGIRKSRILEELANYIQRMGPPIVLVKFLTFFSAFFLFISIVYSVLSFFVLNKFLKINNLNGEVEFCKKFNTIKVISLQKNRGYRKDFSDGGELNGGREEDEIDDIVKYFLPYAKCGKEFLLKIINDAFTAELRDSRLSSHQMYFSFDEAEEVILKKAIPLIVSSKTGEEEIEIVVQSFGCGIGQELYEAAWMITEHAQNNRRFKELVLAGRVHIRFIGYDISLRRLARAYENTEVQTHMLLPMYFHDCIDYAYYYADIRDEDTRRVLLRNKADINICRLSWAFNDKDSAVSFAKELRNNLKSPGVLFFEEKSSQPPYPMYCNIAEIFDKGKKSEVVKGEEKFYSSADGGSSVEKDFRMKSANDGGRRNNFNDYEVVTV